MFPNRAFRSAFKGLCAQKERNGTKQKGQYRTKTKRPLHRKKPVFFENLSFQAKKTVRIEQHKNSAFAVQPRGEKANATLPHPARSLHYIIAADEVADDGAADDGAGEAVEVACDGAADEGAGEAVEVADDGAGDVACAEGADVIFD